MSTEAKKRLIGRIVQDPSFRQQLKVDPEGTIQHSGLDLTEEEYTSVVADIDLSLPDDQLQERLSKRQVLG